MSWIGNVDIWRSEEMQLVQVFVPAEAARDTLDALGSLSCLQFKDLNPEKSAFQRTYANQVKRCDEMARKLRFLTEQVEKAGIAIGGRAATWDKTVTLDELESKLEDLERDVIEVNGNTERLQRTHSELAEFQVLLEKAGQFFDSARLQASRDATADAASSSSNVQDFGTPLLGADREAAAAYDPKASRLGFVAGLIPQEKLATFERLLFRTTRGNMYLRQVPVGRVQDPASGEQVEKSVFVVFFAGERAKTKIMKICEAFGATRYPFPEEVPRQRQTHAEVTARLRELHTTIEAGDLHRQGVLRNVAQNLEQWTLMVRKEKAIYHTLNKMNLDYTAKVLVGEAWVPSAMRARVHEALRQAAEQSHAQVSSVLQPLAVGHEQPPTFFKSNKFTQCFQTIVDAYGIARYREVNPAVFTIMTFPFLFAVMFGDFGHGFLMLFFALALVLNEKRLGKAALDDMSSMAYSGRYCILLMSIFSIYVGAIYNEFFSIPMTLWFGPSKFKCMVGDAPGPEDFRDCGHHGGHLALPPGSEAYPFGVDPAWRGTKTELSYLNSVKMKMSILLGVTHMNLGIIMSLFNNAYFRDHLSTWCEFVPQMIFLNGLFGYLSLLIVYKWITGSMADLYHVMIYMFLSPGTMPEDDPGKLFEGQGNVQFLLLIVALLAVPWMLLPKPLILKKRHEAARGHNYAAMVHRDDDAEHQAAAHGGGGHDAHGHGEFEFGEVMVHQMIHTIEFVLGAISNTASYLRLWALSLAHSQLSAVFYDRVLMAGIQSGSPFAMFIGFFVWACATLGVLMVMESLSAFLHALRLHWVEFQNKFYRGDGYQFAPFSFDGLHGKHESSD